MATAFKSVPPEIMQNMAKTALKTYIQNGYTTVQEGRADAGTSELWRSFVAIGQLDIDVAVYPDLINELPYLLENGTSPTDMTDISELPVSKSAWTAHHRVKRLG